MVFKNNMVEIKQYKITKLGSVENPYHKNSIYGDLEDYYLGYFTKEPKIGERFNLTPIKSFGKPYLGGISTSPVTKIIDDNTFETLNSIYKWEEYDNS